MFADIYFCLGMGRDAAGARWAVGALGEIRTPDPRIRSPMLYPAELRAQSKANTWRLGRPQNLSLGKRPQIRGQGCIRASSACQSTRGCLGVDACDFRGWLALWSSGSRRMDGPLRLIFFGLRRALRPVLRTGLRVADGLGQHLAQLGLRLRRFPREARFLPVSHE
jgi:hypothetical protein